MNNTPSAAPSTSTEEARNEFREVEIIRDPDGVIAVLTERVKDGIISFRLAREYEAKGKTKQSAYLARRHLPAVRRLLADLEDRLELAEDRARARRR